MIKLKELINRVYNGKDCIAFEYHVIDKDKRPDDVNRNCFITRYRVSAGDAKRWRMEVIVPRTRDRDSQVYSFDYILPKEGMDLALIAAIGLRYFQLQIEDEIQMKSSWDFVVGEIVKDM